MGIRNCRIRQPYSEGAWVGVVGEGVEAAEAEGSSNDGKCKGYVEGNPYAGCAVGERTGIGRLR